MQSYKDLEIYKLAHKLATEMHKMSLSLPKFELYEGDSQIRRCSKRVSAAIVEGFGRRDYKQDYIKFLIYAHTSCDETKEHFKFPYETDLLKDKKAFEYFYSEYEKLSKKINIFIQRIKNSTV